MPDYPILAVTVYRRSDTEYIAVDTTWVDDLKLQATGRTAATALLALAQELAEMDAEDEADEADPAFQARILAALHEPATRTLGGS